MRFGFLTGYMILSLALTVFPKSSKTYFEAELKFHRGPNLHGNITKLEQQKLYFCRPFGKNNTLMEVFDLSQIEYIIFPKPTFLDNVATQKYNAASFMKRLRCAKNEYQRWAPFWDIKGSWTAAIAFHYASMLEQRQSFKSALAIYNRILKHSFSSKIKAKTKFRKAIVLFHLAQYDQAEALINECCAPILKPAELAEKNFFLAKIHVRKKRLIQSQLSLYQNLTFYREIDLWYDLSLHAVLDNSLLMHDRSNCQIIAQRLAGESNAPAYQALGSNCLYMLKQNLPIDFIKSNLYLE